MRLTRTNPAKATRRGGFSHPGTHMVTMLKPRLSPAPKRITGQPGRERMRGSGWMKIRDRVLKANPLCVHCKAAGWLTAATEVDHKMPISKGGTDDEGNLQGLCRDCHAAKTKAEQSCL